MPESYRSGPVGALMDEYERAIEELKSVLRTIDVEDYRRIIDPYTEDPDCRSVQTIMNHVVRAGYGYSNYIRKQFGDSWTPRQEQYDLPTPEATCEALEQMLAYTLETMTDKWEISFEEILANPIQAAWGQVYDFEQLLEHAIVHILRHRRQIERLFKKV